jgi:hypothetical protein
MQRETLFSRPAFFGPISTTATTTIDDTFKL